MISYFAVSISFIDSRFHGRGDGGATEWPPSPLRVFQALTASAARMGKGRLNSSFQGALKWLESQSEISQPVIFAPTSFQPGRRLLGYCLSVPNNAMDIVARAWSRGNYSNSGDASPSTHRTMKHVRPLHLNGGNTVCYLWALRNNIDKASHDHIKILGDIACHITALGWGIDMAVGNASIMTEDQFAELPGESWLPSSSESSGKGLRIPVNGTLDDLTSRHRAFLRRMEGNILNPPPPLSVYKKVEYRRAGDPAIRPFAAFSLLRLDASGYRPFNTTRKALTVAGMTRHAAACAAELTHQNKKRISEFILGHGEAQDSGKHVSVGNRRFAYLPLPSIEARGEGQARVIGNIRRIMLTAFEEGCEEEIAWARRTLSGQALEAERESSPVALLSLLTNSDSVVKSYVNPSETWATVTPVVLPGYDDPAHYRRRLKQGVGADEQKRLLIHLHERIDGLIRKSIVQAGFTKVLADNADIEWRKIGFWRGTEPVERYGVPNHLMRCPRYHVKIGWRDGDHKTVKIDGPLCIGGGRFYGLGLFAAF